MEALPLNILMETLFTDKYVTTIYPTERRLNPLRSTPFAIHSAKASEKLSSAAALPQKEKERSDSNYTRESEMKNTNKLRAAKQTAINPYTTPEVFLVCKGQGLMYFKKRDRLFRRAQLTFAKEIMEVLPSLSYYIFTVNAASTDLHMQKHMIMG